MEPASPARKHRDAHEEISKHSEAFSQQFQEALNSSDPNEIWNAAADYSEAAQLSRERMFQVLSHLHRLGRVPRKGLRLWCRECSEPPAPRFGVARPIVSQNRLDDSFEAARDEVSLFDKSIRFTRCAHGDLHFTPGGLRVVDHHHPLSPTAIEALCKKSTVGKQPVCIPAHYLARLPGEMQASLLNHHLENGDIFESDILIYSKDDTIVAFGDDLLTLNGRDVVTAVWEGIGPIDLQRHSLSFGDTDFELVVLGHGVEREVVPGDVVQGGISVRHCRAGSFATRIESFVLRLTCRNGLLSRECVSRRAARTRRLPSGHPNARELQMMQIRSLAAKAFATLDEKLDAIADLRHRQENVEKLIERTIHRGRLRRGLVSPILEAWKENGADDTRYAAVNALTWVATHSIKIEERERRALSMLAGVLAFARLHFCTKCYSVLRSRD